jgi:hypothetical protein
MKLTINAGMDRIFRIMQLRVFPLPPNELQKLRSFGQIDIGKRQHLSSLPIAELCSNFKGGVECRKCSEHCKCAEGFRPGGFGKCSTDFCSSTISFVSPEEARKAARMFMEDEQRNGREHELVEIDRGIPCV